MFTLQRASSRMLASLTVLVYLQVAPAAFGDLASTYKEYLQQRNQAVSWNAETAKAWIGRFQTELPQSNTKDPAFYHVLLALGDLCDSTGDRETSMKVRESILLATDAPDLLRLQAGIAIFFLKDRAHAEPVSLLELIAQVEEIYKTGKLGPSREAFALDMQILRFKSAQLSIAAAQAKVQGLEAQGAKSEAAETRIAGYSKGETIFGDYLSDWPKLSDTLKKGLKELNYGQDAAMYEQGKARVDLALAYLATGRKVMAQSAFSSATNQLLELLSAYPKNVQYAQPSAVLLLKIREQNAGAGTSAYVQFVKELMAKVPPGHTLLNHLTDVACSLSRGQTRSIATDLFNIIISQESLWFPEDYKSHVNYQVALLESTVNYLGSNNLKAANERLGVIQETPITDRFLQERSSAVVKLYGDRFSEASARPSKPITRSWFLVVNIVLLITLIVVFMVRRYRRAHE